VSTWIAILAVGSVSYVFRAAPLLVLGRMRLSDRVDRLVRHASSAALTALLAGAVTHGGDTSVNLAILAATACGLVVAACGRSMLRVVLAGALTYAATTLVLAGL
jgi:branched-subunit amino acid transport protein